MPARQLTVLIPCKDELANIGLCVDAALAVAAEVLVADSGSTDGTLEYLRRRGDCRLIEREYRTYGDFINWAAPHARHEWVLLVDADERVTPALADEIRELLGDTPRADGYWIPRDNHLMGHRVRYTDWGRDRVLRLFRRDLARCEGPSDHAKMAVSSGQVGALRQPLDHYTLWSWDQYLKKFDRYTRLQAEEWYAAGRRPSYLRMLLQPPLRFLRDFVLHRGFLDGAAGVQIAWMCAFYTFMKQARLWELHHARGQSEVAREAIAAAERPAA